MLRKPFRRPSSCSDPPGQAEAVVLSLPALRRDCAGPPRLPRCPGHDVQPRRALLRAHGAEDRQPEDLPLHLQDESQGARLRLGEGWRALPVVVGALQPLRLRRQSRAPAAVFHGRLGCRSASIRPPLRRRRSFAAPPLLRRFSLSAMANSQDQGRGAWGSSPLVCPVRRRPWAIGSSTGVDAQRRHLHMTELPVRSGMLDRGNALIFGAAAWP